MRVWRIGHRFNFTPRELGMLEWEEIEKLIQLYKDDCLLRGIITEEKFLCAWKNHNFPIVLSVRKSTPEEDHKEKTDAVMCLQNGIEIRFQLKSGLISKKHIKKFACEFGIVLMTLRGINTAEDIRNTTIEAIRLFYQSILTENPTEGIITNPTDIWFK